MLRGVVKERRADGVLILQGAGLTSWMTNPGTREQGAKAHVIGKQFVVVHDDVMGTQCARVKTVPWQSGERTWAMPASLDD